MEAVSAEPDAFCPVSFSEFAQSCCLVMLVIGEAVVGYQEILSKSNNVALVYSTFREAQTMQKANPCTILLTCSLGTA